MRLGDVAGDLLGPHQRLAPVGQRVFLAGLAAPAPLSSSTAARRYSASVRAASMRFRSSAEARSASRRSRCAGGHRRRLGLEAAEGVEQRAMDVRIDHGAVVVLAVDLDQRRAELAEQRHRDRLVVDEGAAAPVAALDAAEDQVAVGLDAALGEQARGRDGRRATSKTAVTSPCSAPCRTSALSPRPPSASDSASSRIDLPAPVSPVSTVRPCVEIDVQAVDEDDVADREGDEHGLTGGPRLRSRTSR